MRRGGLLVLALALPWAGGAVAQNFSPVPGVPNVPLAGVEQVWAEFESSCTALLTDPAAFVTNHPTQGPFAAPGIARTTDNQVVVMSHLTPAGVYRQMELIGVPGELHVVCEAYSIGVGPAFDNAQAYGAAAGQTFAAFRALMQSKGFTVVGGSMPQVSAEWQQQVSPYLPQGLQGYVGGAQVEMAGAKRFVYAQTDGAHLDLAGHYVIRAEDYARAQAERKSTAAGPPSGATARQNAPQSPRPPVAASAAMRQAAEICLRNYRDPASAPDAFRAAGFRISPGAGQGSWEFSGNGVSGQINVGGELSCTVSSQTVPLAQAQSIGNSLATSGFPGMVQPGAPEGGNGPCDGLSIFAPRQLIWMHYAQAGNSGQCIDDGTSTIIIN